MDTSTEIVVNNETYVADYFEIEFFKEAVVEKRNESEHIIETVADAILGIDTVKKAHDSRSEIRLVADLTPEMRKAIKDGTKKLDISGDKIFAQLRDKNGKWSDKITLKQLPGELIDPLALSTAMQMKAIEKKLEDITATLEVISNDIETVRVGQANDRLGLYESGIHLYRESQLIGDSAFRILIVSQAIKSLSDSCSQEMQCIKTDIKYLIDGCHMTLPKGKVLGEIDKRLANINKCLEIVHKATILRAGIYFRLGEIEAMLDVFDEYGAFLQENVITYSGKLTELDSNERRIDSSKWTQKAKVLFEIDQLKKQINQNTSIYIEGDTIYAKKR